MKTILDHKNMTQFESCVVLEEVYKCIKIASKCGGKVYGGFVRDVIVPRLHNPECEIGFKNVDLWFKTEDAAKTFVRKMGEKIKETGEIKEGIYPKASKRNQYYLIKYDTWLAWMYIIVSNDLPVNDFDVNEVTYMLKDGEWQTESPKRLIRQIEKKKAVMLLEFYDMMEKGGCDHKHFHEERMKRIFIEKGWEILIPSGIKNKNKIF